MKTSSQSADLQALYSSFAIIAFALDGTIRRVNTNFLRLVGYKAREIVGLHHSVFVPQSETIDLSYHAFWSALQRGETQSGEYHRVHKSGSDLWFQATYTPVTDSEGKFFEVVALVADITALKLKAAEDRGQIIAINTSQAVVHFTTDGTVTHANDLFLQTMGYRLDEVEGQHHRLFVDAHYAESADYTAFWASLAEGKHQAAEYKRIGKDGREVWLQATYNPIFDMNGRPFKVVKYAVDVTQERLRQADHEGQIAAIHKSQVVVTFGMDGTVIDANDHFLAAMGYGLDEVAGRHHRMFVEPSHVHGPEYAKFWNDLSEGRHQAGEYRRIDRNGREVWLQATYSPVFDLNGRPSKVVKYATVITREKLRQADHQGQIASIHKAQCVISFTVDGIILDANDNFLTMTGYRLSQIRGRHHRMFVDRATAESQTYDIFWKDLGRGLHKAAEYKRICNDGSEIWLQATYNPIFDMNGRPFKVVKYATDVTQEKLRQADYEGQMAAIHKSQCMAAFDMDGIVLDANDNFLKAMGYRLEEIKGQHHRIFMSAGTAETEQYKAFWDKLRSGAFLSEKLKRIGKDGREVWIQATYNPIMDLNGKPFKVIKIATDVTADVAMAADLTIVRQQAEHDTTTSLPNRVRLADFVKSILSRPDGRLAILYLDLDHFKPINDTFGHHIGDHVLSVTADRLRSALHHDQMVARIGGDEFVVAAPDLLDDEIEVLCKRLIAAVTEPIRHEKVALTVGLSIGVAVSPHDATTQEDLLRCADVALYRSKGNGRGGYCFFGDDMNGKLVANRHLADDMLHGIKASSFFLEFQPRFSARTRTVQSVEALVRWNHPERGRLEPTDFIPVAEKSGLIVPLGEWVLRTACQAAKQWPGIGVSVNISPVQFRSGNLIDAIRNVLSETGLEPGRLELEIAEADVLQDQTGAHTALDAIKTLGVRLALDGFGSGSTSLDDLRRFPFDGIKIDRRFIADIEDQKDGRSIVQSILEIEQNPGLSVTVGGIETTRQLLLLSLGGCTEVQGFSLAHPMDASAVEMLLNEGAMPLAG